MGNEIKVALYSLTAYYRQFQLKCWSENVSKQLMTQRNENAKKIFENNEI